PQHLRGLRAEGQSRDHRRQRPRAVERRRPARRTRRGALPEAHRGRLTSEHGLRTMPANVYLLVISILISTAACTRARDWYGPDGIGRKRIREQSIQQRRWLVRQAVARRRP